MYIQWHACKFPCSLSQGGGAYPECSCGEHIDFNMLWTEHVSYLHSLSLLSFPSTITSPNPIQWLAKNFAVPLNVFAINPLRVLEVTSTSSDQIQKWNQWNLGFALFKTAPQLKLYSELSNLISRNLICKCSAFGLEQSYQFNKIRNGNTWGLKTLAGVSHKQEEKQSGAL